MRIRKVLTIATMLFVSGFGPDVTLASPIIYSNLSDFEAARSDFISDALSAGIILSLDDFNDVPDGSNSVPSIVRTDFTITHDANVRTEKPLFNQSGTENLTGGIAWDYVGESNIDSLVFTFNNPINAFGFDLIDFGDTGTGTDPKLYLDIGAGEILVLDVSGDRPNGDEQFVGIIDTMAAYSSVTIRTVNSAGIDTILGDDVRYGVVNVPEPTTLALFGIGLVGMGFARRRKSV